MATITTRAGKGSPLTNTEVDSNFTNLNTDKLEDTDLSVTTASASSGGTLAYTSGVFTFAPADLSSYITNLSGLGVTATSTELNVLDGIPATLTTTELGYVDGVTSSIQTQLNAKGVGSVTSVGGTGTVSGLTLTGTVTGSGNLTLGGTLDAINLASGVTGTLPIANGGTGGTSAAAALTNFGLTATVAEINVLDGIPAGLTATELGYVDGVTSAIQTQLNAKGTVSTLGDLSITATATELNYTSGVTSAIQTQIDNKEPADGTILKDADIGVSVLAFDTNLQAFVTAFTVPTSDGTSGQALITNGSGSIAFGDVDALPSQTGNSGKYLTTDGTDSSWAVVDVGEFVYTRTLYTATSGQTVFNATYDVGYVDVFLNGIKILLGTEFTATNGTSITLATGATTGDLIEILAHSTYNTIVQLKNADGGFANSTYTSVQSVNGGSA
jgi:hypothetical protein